MSSIDRLREGEQGAAAFEQHKRSISTRDRRPMHLDHTSPRSPHDRSKTHILTPTRSIHRAKVDQRQLAFGSSGSGSDPRSIFMHGCCMGGALVRRRRVSAPDPVRPVRTGPLDSIVHRLLSCKLEQCLSELEAALAASCCGGGCAVLCLLLLVMQ